MAEAAIPPYAVDDTTLLRSALEALEVAQTWMPHDHRLRYCEPVMQQITQRLERSRGAGHDKVTCGGPMYCATCQDDRRR